MLVGQVLKIPTQIQKPDQEETITEYQVVSGDSLYKIAKKYNTTVDMIKKTNNLS